MLYVSKLKLATQRKWNTMFLSCYFVFCRSSSCEPHEHTFPAFHGRYPWKHGNILSFFYRDKQYTRHGVQVIDLVPFASCPTLSHLLGFVCRSWQQKDEEILMDMETCSMAFRILRMHGYHISSGNCKIWHLYNFFVRFGNANQPPETLV